MNLEFYNCKTKTFIPSGKHFNNSSYTFFHHCRKKVISEFRSVPRKFTRNPSKMGPYIQKTTKCPHFFGIFEKNQDVSNPQVIFCGNPSDDPDASTGGQ